MKKSIVMLLLVCMALTLLPPSFFAVDSPDRIAQGNSVATVEGEITYRLSNLKVESTATTDIKINTILVSVDTGTFAPGVPTTDLGTVTTLETVGNAGMTRTYIIQNSPTVEKAQEFLRGIQFTLADENTR